MPPRQQKLGSNKEEKRPPEKPTVIITRYIHQNTVQDSCVSWKCKHQRSSKPLAARQASRRRLGDPIGQVHVAGEPGDVLRRVTALASRPRGLGHHPGVRLLREPLQQTPVAFECRLVADGVPLKVSLGPIQAPSSPLLYTPRQPPAAVEGAPNTRRKKRRLLRRQSAEDN